MLQALILTVLTLLSASQGAANSAGATTNASATTQTQAGSTSSGGAPTTQDTAPSMP